MQISAEQVRQVAALARLGLREDEIQALRQQLQAILGYVEQLGELDLAEVEGTAQVLPFQGLARPDQSRPFPAAERIVSAAPARQGDLFQVPRILPD